MISMEFIILTVCLGGGAAWMTGRAIARAWQGYLRLGFYILLLACAVRFLHFALFHGTLLSATGFLIDFATLMAIAMAGRISTRMRQMASQYRPFSADGSPLAGQ